LYKYIIIINKKKKNFKIILYKKFFFLIFFKKKNFVASVKNYIRNNKVVIEKLCDKYQISLESYNNFQNTYPQVNTLEKFKNYFGENGNIFKINRIMG
jgi:hypothetical protein